MSKLRMTETAGLFDYFMLSRRSTSTESNAVRRISPCADTRCR